MPKRYATKRNYEGRLLLEIGFKLGKVERQMLDSCRVQKLYMKAFELGFDKKQVIRKASIRFEEALPKKNRLCQRFLLRIRF